MSSPRSAALLLFAACAAVFASPVPAHAQPAPAVKPAPAPAALSTEPGSEVEVREGDVWSKATIVKKEGRRIQIRYEDGTEEWVTADRLRAKGGGGAGAAGPAVGTSPATKPADAPAAKAEVFKVGDAVEYKDGNDWEAGSVKNRDGELYLIVPDGRTSQFWWRWTTVDCVRAIGSSKPGPDREDQLSQTLHNDAPVKVLNEMKRKLPAHRQRMASKAKVEASGEKTGGAFDAEPFEHPLTDANTAGVKRIVETMKEGPWTYKPSAAPTTRPVGPTVAVDLEGGTNEFNEQIVALDVRPPWALVTYKSDWNNAKQVTVELANVSGGRASRFLAHYATLPMGVTSDGKTLVGMANGFFGGTKARVDVWTVDGKELKHAISFAPHAKSRGGTDVDAVLLADDAHLLTANARGEVTCWEYAKARAVWTTDLDARPAMKLLPDGKTVALLASGQVTLIDVQSGALVGTIDDAPSASLLALAVSPDGTRLGALTPNVLWTWDLTTGKRLPSIGFGEGNRAATLQLFNDGVAWVGSDVIDLQSGAVVGRYNVEPAASTSAQGLFWAVSKASDRTKARMLCSWKLPNEQLLLAVKQARAAAQPADATVRLADQPGGISLEVSVDAPEEQKQQIVKSLTKDLASRGVKVADGQPVKLVVRTEDGKSEQRTYQTMGGPPWERETSTVTVTQKITRVYVEREGKRLWETQTASGAGFMLSRKQGQSMQDAANEQSRANLSFVSSVRVPDVIPPQPEGEPALQGQLVPGGVKMQRR